MEFLQDYNPPPWVVRLLYAIGITLIVIGFFSFVSFLRRRRKSLKIGHKVFKDVRQVEVMEGRMELEQIRDHIKARVLDTERALKQLNDDLTAVERSLTIREELVEVSNAPRASVSEVERTRVGPPLEEGDSAEDDEGEGESKEVVPPVELPTVDPRRVPIVR